MSTINSKNVQVGTSGTATDNFTLYQPATPDGTVRLGVGNSGATTSDVVTVNSSGVTVTGVVAVPAGSAAAPSISPTGDTNTGVFFPSADTIAFAEGGVEVARFNADAQFVVAAGTASLPVITTTGDTNTGIFFPAADTIAFTEGGVESARIDSSGRLLVGTTSTIGAARFVVEQDTAVANPMAVSNPRSSAATDYAIMFYRNASLVGSIQTSLSATSYVTSSDYRLKHDIQPMTGALAKVAALKPVIYKWNIDDSESQGFIAHELQEVVPECVTGEKDAVDADGNPQYQGIDTSFLVATLTAAIQELRGIVDSQAARIAALEGAAQ